MSKEEYDDLDDLLLDEDPAALDIEKEAQSKNGNSSQSKISSPQSNNQANDNDTEAQKMMTDLQKEFSNLLKQQDSSLDGEVSAGDKEAIDNFNNLIGVLGDATRATSNAEKKVNNENNEAGFKDVISNTLDRLKESGTKIDSNLKQEKEAQDSNDVLSQLLGQLVDGAGENGDMNFNEDGMDNAILNILNQMSSKEVLYTPMKEMQVEFTKWLEEHGKEDQYKEKMDIYRNQYALVNDLVNIYEREDYENEIFREDITSILDELEQLGDSPVNKGFNNGPGNKNGLEDMSKLLQVDGNEEEFGNIDQEIADSCKQQ